jgi:hypothetical protein
MSKVTYKPRTLEQCLSDSNLRHAATKVANYYRTQNYPFSPDRAMPALMQVGLAQALRTAVLDGTYTFQPLRPYWTPKPNGKGMRMESMSSGVDRILIQALFNHAGYAIQQDLSATALVDRRLMAPAYRFNRPTASYTYSFWPADYRAYRSLARRFAARRKQGVALHLDIQNFYPSVRIERLKSLLRPWFADDVFELVSRYLDFRITPNNGEAIPFLAGLPVEEPMSRLLANLYLQALDHHALYELKLDYIRYVDDIIIFLPDQSTAETIKSSMVQYLPAHLGLFVNEAKVEIKSCRDFISESEADFSRRLSKLNTEVGLIPFMPETHRTAVIGKLQTLVRQMPSPNLPSDKAKAKTYVRGAKFGAWRLAKVGAEQCEQDLSVLLHDSRTRVISAIALAHLGSPAAVSALQKHLDEVSAQLHPFERVQIAGTLARNKLLGSFHHFEAYANDNTLLRSILSQFRADAASITTALSDCSPMVRRAALIASLNADRPQVAAGPLLRAAANEQDRDCMLLLMYILAKNPRRFRAQREIWKRHQDPLIAEMAQVLKTPNRAKPSASSVNQIVTQCSEI